MAREHTYRIDGEGNTMTRPLTAQNAIVVHCCECMGFDVGRSTACSSLLCALFPYSPFGDGSRRGIYFLLGKGGDGGGDGEGADAEMGAPDSPGSGEEE